MLSMLRGLLLENLSIKLVALLLAMLLYLHVYTERPATMVVSFPLEISDLADTLALTGDPPEPVRAELRGTGKQLIRLRLTEPSLKMSLAGVGPGRYERTVTVDDLPLLSSERIEVQQLVSPRLIQLQIDHRIERELPVAARVEGVPRAGWRWGGSVEARPAVVRVRGPRDRLAVLDSVRLEVVRLDGKADTVRAETRPDSLPFGCEVEDEKIEVVVPLERVATAGGGR